MLSKDSGSRVFWLFLIYGQLGKIKKAILRLEKEDPMNLRRTVPAFIFCVLLAAGLCGCGGSGSGGSGVSGVSSSGDSPNSQPRWNSVAVIVPSDLNDTLGSSTSSVLQVVHPFDTNGNPLSAPAMSSTIYNGTGDLDGAALVPGSTNGVLIEGNDSVLYFFSFAQGWAITSQPSHSLGTYGADGDSIALANGGDLAIVALDGTDSYHHTALVLASGINSGSFNISYLDTPGYRDGVLLSGDDTVLLARGPGGLTVFSVNANALPNSSAFTETDDMSSLGTSNGNGGGRDGMAISPSDSSRAVIITNGTSSPSKVSLLTGLPSIPSVANSVSVTGLKVFSVAVAPSGDLAVVGTDSGLLMFSGVSSGALKQVGSGPYAPTYAVNNHNVALGTVTSLVITSDGKYVVAGDFYNGALLVVPMSAGGFGAPVGILPGVQVPWNDEMLIN